MIPIKTYPTEYVVVLDSNLLALVRLVNEKVGEGWEPQGGIAIERSEDLKRTCYLQALLRKANTTQIVYQSMDAALLEARIRHVVKDMV